MPVNRNALIRYRTIDKCLQNRRRKWTVEDLMDACSEALFEFEGEAKSISLRTIRLDLSALRSDRLGYNAPIVVKDKKYYTYEDPAYSITKIPLSQQDLGVLQEVSQLLRQFKGFSHFDDISEMVNKLEDKVYSEQHQQQPVIDFEKNELLTGIEWLDPLHKAIVNETPLLITYQSFKAREASDVLFYPYLLKEYRNRWFVLGMKQQGKEILTFALDRIAGITPKFKEPFVHHPQFHPQEYFSQIVGVTRNTGNRPVNVIFEANAHHAPYIKTKPIHHSQKIMLDEKGSTRFCIHVIPNFELERELIGFGEGVKVVSPASLVSRMKRRIGQMQALYADPH
jgi:predicted DNA-binding transcriptional regulator YafY